MRLVTLALLVGLYAAIIPSSEGGGEGGVGSSAFPKRSPTPATNVVLIISDDAGYADWGFMDDFLESRNPGQAETPVPTPHLDALRNRGVLFTSAYTAPVCSPSRAAIVTGSYQNRIGYEFNINNLTGANALDGLHPSTQTIFHRMKGAGYTTGAMGKWHIGARANDNGLGNRPENMMVDEFFGIWKGSRNYTVGAVTGTGTLRETVRQPFIDTVLESTAPWNTTYNYTTTAFTQGALDFIDRHYADPDPFFLYVAYTAPHGPIGNSPDINDPRIAGLSGKRKQYASMVLTMDKDIGRIIDKLDDPAGDGSVSLTDNTLVIFINDNGGASGNGTVNTPLNNWKGSVYEGGIRVPMIMAGPGVPSDTNTPIEFAAPVHSMDILPTCLAATGGAPPPGLDGVNLLPYLNGAPGIPHEVLTFRSGNKVGVRKGAWKLVKNGGGSTFELYDLATDLTETNDVAGTNPLVVDELLRDFTAFEAGCDKPRHAGLNNGAGSINLNDHFRFAPTIDANSTNGIPTGPDLIRNGGFELGTDTDGDGRFTFAELDAWSNAAGGTNDVAAINNDAYNGTFRGVFVSGAREPMQLTSHLVWPGERMFLEFYHKGKTGWDNTDTITVELFYLGGSPDVLSAQTFNPQTTGWRRERWLSPAITNAAAINRPLGLRFISSAGASEFVSIDEVMLSTGAEGTLLNLPWSELGRWIDTDTDASDDLLPGDGFAGAILEFPLFEDASYIADNDRVRETGLPFMANQLRFSGSTTGLVSRLVIVRGNEVLLTRDLAGGHPEIRAAAMGADQRCEVHLDLTLLDDLLLAGDGDAPVTIRGSMRDYYVDHPRSVTKQGTSTFILNTGRHDYSGETQVDAGTLWLEQGVDLATPLVQVASNAMFGGTGSLAGSLWASGTVQPEMLNVDGDAVLGTWVNVVDGKTAGELVVGQTLDLRDATLALSEEGVGATQSEYVLGRYEMLSGPFAQVNGLPAGYQLDYAYNDGGSINTIALVTNSVPVGYAAWIAASGETGGAAAFDADPNGDGVENGLAFFLGANNASTPVVTPALVSEADANDWVVEFLRSDRAAGHRYELQVRTDLPGGVWQSAGPDATREIIDEGASDRICYRIPRTGDRMYARLLVIE